MNVSSDSNHATDSPTLTAPEGRSFQQILEAIRDIVFTADADGLLNYITPAGFAKPGCATASMLGKPFTILVAPAWRAAAEAFYAAQLQTRTPETRREFPFLCHSGEERWMQLDVSLLADGDRITGFQGVAHDLTERKFIEAQLQRREAQLAEAQHVAQMGSWEWDIASNTTMWSEELYRIYGVSPDTFVPSNEAFFSLLPPEERARVMQIEAAALREGGSFDYEHRLIRADGTVSTILNRSRIIMGKRGNPVRMVGTSQDITERKHAEEAIAHERDLLRTLIDNSPDYIFVKDREGKFVLSNIAHTRAAVQADSPDALVGKTAFEVFPPDLAEKFNADDQAVLSSGQSLLNVERQTIDKDGNPRWVLTTKVVMRDVEDEISGLVGMSRDITARKQVEAQAIELGVEKEKVRLIADFIQNASHDLKTPLSVAYTSAYLAQKTADSQVRDRHLREIETQLTDLGRIIEELLAMANLDAATEFEIEPVDVNELVDGTVKDMTRRIEEKHLRVICDFDPSTPVIHGDQSHLGQALHRILENAILYTPDGGTIRVSTARRDHTMQIEVQDNGIGISEADLPFIFERFYKANHARTYDKSGAGLGLSIARKIIMLHKGILEAESQLGDGSTFRVLLPIRQDGYDQPLIDDVL